MRDDIKMGELGLAETAASSGKLAKK